MNSTFWTDSSGALKRPFLLGTLGALGLPIYFGAVMGIQEGYSDIAHLYGMGTMAPMVLAGMMSTFGSFLILSSDIYRKLYYPILAMGIVGLALNGPELYSEFQNFMMK